VPPSWAVSVRWKISRSPICARERRLTFVVDLGAAHSLEQGTSAELAAASDPNYFLTRKVCFEPRRDEECRD
jgi:hypothetical protein